MIDTLTAALKPSLEALGVDLEFQVRALAGEARAYGLRRLANAGDAVLLPGRWAGLMPTTWKRPGGEDGVDPPLRRLQFSRQLEGAEYLFCEVTAPDSLTISAYECGMPGEMDLLATRVLPVELATWSALVAR